MHVFIGAFRHAPKRCHRRFAAAAELFTNTKHVFLTPNIAMLRPWKGGDTRSHKHSKTFKKHRLKLFSTQTTTAFGLTRM